MDVLIINFYVRRDRPHVAPGAYAPADSKVIHLVPSFFEPANVERIEKREKKGVRMPPRLRIAGGSRSDDANSRPKTFAMYNSSRWSAYARYYACSRDNDTMFAVAQRMSSYACVVIACRVQSKPLNP